MKQKILSMVLVLLAAWGWSADLTTIIAPGTVAKKLAGGFKFTEGATVNAAGELFFVDQPNNKILRWHEGEGLRVFMAPSGYANGMCFTADGTLLVCADERTELWAVTPDGQITVLVNSFNGKMLNGPNDVWPHPNNQGCYLTDPFYRRSWWSHVPMPQPGQHVYYLAYDGTLTQLTDDLKQPNGIVGSADGTTLYVADIGDRKTYRYTIAGAGKLTERRLFCEMGSDGMTLDSQGNVYLTGKGVHVFDKNGAKLGVIEIPEDWCGNVAIGGPDKQTLFITASTGLYAVPLKVKGIPGGK